MKAPAWTKCATSPCGSLGGSDDCGLPDPQTRIVPKTPNPFHSTQFHDKCGRRTTHG